MSKRTAADFARLITTQSITITFDGETHTIRKEDGATYQMLLDAMKEERWDDVPHLLKPDEVINALSKGMFRIDDGNIYVSNDNQEHLVPTKLSETILSYRDQNLPFEPLVKFAINLCKNPSARSIEQLFGFIEHNKFTITTDGKFLAYKGVRSDFKDCHTGTIDNSVGTVVKMEREEVDADPNRTCSSGLHVAGHTFAHTQYGSGRAGITLIIEVDPKDVVSVPVDYNNTKMRVCEYKVVGVSNFEYSKPIYDSSVSAEDNFAEEDTCGECGLYTDECACDLCDACGQDISGCWCDEDETEKDDLEADSEEKEELCEECDEELSNCDCDEEIDY